LTNINKTPVKEKGYAAFNKPTTNLRYNSLRRVGSKIIENNLKIKTDLTFINNENSPKNLLTNGNNYLNNNLQNQYSTSNKIDLINTKGSLKSKSKFFTTIKSKQSSLAYAANTNKLNPIMLTTLTMNKGTFGASEGNKNKIYLNSNYKTNSHSTYKKNKFLSKNYNETFGDGKNSKKIAFYKSHNNLIKKDNSSSYNNNINLNTENNLKIMSSSLNKNNSSGNMYSLRNSPTANFQHSYSNKKSLEIADLSMIKPSPENELRVNLLQQKCLQGPSDGGSYMQRIRKIRTLDNKLVDKREIIFNKIYSYNTEFNKLIKAEQGKKFDTLYDYQNHLVQFIAEKTSMDNLRNLSQKLKNVREINECYNPVNKVNWKLFGKIMNGCKEEIRSIRQRSNFNGESEVIQNSEHFIKQLGLVKKKQINLNKKFSKYESSLKRISPYIPEYLVEKFTKSLKIIN